MDHKRGYDYLEDQAAQSPTKRLKDLSHQRDYQCHRGPAAQDSQSSWSDSSRAPQLGERYNAEIHRSQYKAQIKHGRQSQSLHSPELPAEITPVKVEAPTYKHGSPADWNREARTSDLEKEMEEAAYHSMVPIVKKELENWAFHNNRSPKRVIPPNGGSDDPDDETTCDVCRSPRKFKGWDALLIHAQKYSKQMPWQHRGYSRALQEALLDKKLADQEQAMADHASGPLPPPGKPCTDFTHKMDVEQHKQTAGQNAHWKPDILIVETQEFNEVSHVLKARQEQGGSQKPQLREMLAIFAHGDGDEEQRHVFVFPASKVGYVGEKEINSCRQSGELERHKASRQSVHKTPAETVGDAHRSSSEIVSSPKKSEVARCESLKEALGLQLTLDDPDDTPGKKLFDLEQIHRTSSVVKRWAENFKSSAQRFETQRVFRDSPLLVAIDKGFRADLKQIKSYSPGCKRKIKEQMSKIEDRFREDHLMCLQQVEKVREHFQELADDVQQKEAREKFLEMRAEVEISKEIWKREKEGQHEALRAAQAKAVMVFRRRKAKQRQERAQLMQLWMEDAEVFKQESKKAKEERRRLQKIHDKVHDRAKVARKDCLVCSESFRVGSREISSSP